MTGQQKEKTDSCGGPVAERLHGMRQLFLVLEKSYGFINTHFQHIVHVLAEFMRSITTRG